MWKILWIHYFDSDMFATSWLLVICIIELFKNKITFWITCMGVNNVHNNDNKPRENSSDIYLQNRNTWWCAANLSCFIYTYLTDRLEKVCHAKHIKRVGLASITMFRELRVICYFSLQGHTSIKALHYSSQEISK